ncbi:hypothetical protein M2451_004128 [Dysgonomonas sp. PFB1-18]|uniref:hypothetical protein n=1 Tax=unclassified Dysgonomonas TaxID=2630389 RepID=UPI0024766847|nr:MULTISPECIES: hypothetical protein [unclassified Dysgonomonas]MDH6311205.1 hypothetical protein [Dysgonomonas sp. PF1-14]MDH6341089.1 hypothetical protein [Dysgonomonas sp. PF1-16]MDH6382777.1 hypothetical protein [Dysgonomonas sp. PFB1-18]MDH6400077.1 hypothetical protein [Dysgonomonas sp. PF1-23]
MDELKTKYTRKELYELIWTEPLYGLSQKFNISYPNLKKLCDKMCIPLPLKGYWTNIKLNKPVTRISFIEKYEGDLPFIDFNALDTINIPEISFQGKLKLQEKNVQNDKRLTFKIPKKFNNPDKLILDYQRRGSMYTNDTLRIKTSDSNINRSLLFLDTLIKNLRIRGHGIEVKYEKTKFLYNNEEDYLNFSILEKSNWKQETNKWGRTDNTLVFNGKLCFRCGHFNFDQKEWIDKDDLLIEDRMINIIAYMEVKGKEEYELRLERDYRHKIQEEEERIKRDFKKSQELELLHFKELFTLADRFQKTKIIRDYINEYERNILERNMMTEAVQKWISWARKKADWYDPFLELDDDLFESLDRDSLTEIVSI